MLFLYLQFTDGGLEEEMGSKARGVKRLILSRECTIDHVQTFFFLGIYTYDDSFIPFRAGPPQHFYI